MPTPKFVTDSAMPPDWQRQEPEPVQTSTEDEVEECAAAKVRLILKPMVHAAQIVLLR